MTFFDDRVYMMAVFAIDNKEGASLEEISESLKNGDGRFKSAVCRSEINHWPYFVDPATTRDLALEASRKLDRNKS